MSGCLNSGVSIRLFWLIKSLDPGFKHAGMTIEFDSNV